MPLVTESDAESVAHLLAETPGFPEDWHEGGTVLQLGLAKAGSPGRVDPEKVRMLRTEHPDALTPGDVASALHLPEGTGFRIRAHPQLAPAMDGSLREVAGMRVAYVLPTAGAGAKGVREMGTLQNVTAFAPRIATTGEFDPAAPADAYLADGALPGRLDLRLWGFRAVHHVLGEGSAAWRVANYTPDEPTAVTPAGGDADRVLAFTRKGSWGYGVGEGARLVVTRLDLQNITPDAQVELSLRDWVDGHVLTLPLDGGTVEDRAHVEVLDCTGACDHAWTVVDALRATEEGAPRPAPTDFPARTIDLSAYAGRNVWLALRWAPEIDTVSLGASLEAGEGWLVDELRVTQTVGPAETVLYTNAFDGRGTRQVDALVVGSDVEQDALAIPALRDAIQANVRGGLGLVVLGSDNLSSGWLTPRIQTNETVGSGTSLFPDATDLQHPVMRIAHDLSFLATPTHPREHAATTYPLGEHFTAPLYLQGASGLVPLLAASSPNEEFAGGVLLTAYQPGAWTSELDRTHLLVNLLAYTHLYEGVVDFGGEAVPAHLPFVASRLTLVMDDDSLGATRLDLTVVLWR